MTGTRTLLPDQTVLVAGDRIVATGDRVRVEVPASAVRIDGAGNCLMPGLADMHVHIFSADKLLLYVTNGVTTVRNMWGWELHLELRERVRDGQIVGPSIYTAGALIDGQPPQLQGSAVAASAEAAAGIVADQVRAGVDFVKVYNRLSAEAYDGVAAGQQSIEHLAGVPELAGGRAQGWSARLDEAAMEHRRATEL